MIRTNSSIYQPGFYMKETFRGLKNHRNGEINDGNNQNSYSNGDRW